MPKEKPIAALIHAKSPHVSFTISISRDPFYWSGLSPPSPLLGYNLALSSIQHAGGCQNNLDKGHIQPHDSYYPEPSLEKSIYLHKS